MLEPQPQHQFPPCVYSSLRRTALGRTPSRPFGRFASPVFPHQWGLSLGKLLAVLQQVPVSQYVLVLYSTKLLACVRTISRKRQTAGNHHPTDPFLCVNQRSQGFPQALVASINQSSCRYSQCARPASLLHLLLPASLKPTCHHRQLVSTMDPAAPPAQAQGQTQESNGASHTNNNHSVPGSGNHHVPAPDLNSLPQADLSSLPPLQGLPADMNMLSMIPQDGTLLTDTELMGMPLMMPMMMDGSNMVNLPPQNGITNGMFALTSDGAAR